MTWRQVYGTIKNDNPGRIVTGRKGPHTLVTISKSAAVLFGAFYSNGISHDDCWLLDLHKAREQKEPSIIWTRLPNHFSRGGHAAVVEPVSQRPWECR